MQVHETAFVVSTYRSHHEDVSKDTYAKLWNNPSTDALIPDILKNVSEHEAILHSLRNRFFHESLTSFFEANNGGTLINFGAGFSMYQFQMMNNVSTIEIDKKDIIDYKKERIDLWITQGKLPQRDIKYASVDFNIQTEEEIINIIKPLIKKEPTFIVLEGVLFFLNQNTTDKLFRIFKELQETGDQVGSVSYLPEIESTEVYQRLLHYFDSHNDTNDSFMHQTTTHSFYEKIDGYHLKEYTDEFELSKLYAPDCKIDNKSQILNENMYILERI
ncbi:class I SAM-dependent methyltransferase [Aquimarina sp. MMG016]|uniref:class I SAM-dependent methyltransferase n=1 Tax=Aquimarina sp. MMG016 TaxID=2822690 RepID=UPI001B3A7990|nr:class I SAM-dependent methyltransferase [Aquimarina sp. MMG016]MBQ4820465.1 class I SAM-dependent methyltransferase [Aquimarina sp. MMG016]